MSPTVLTVAASLLLAADAGTWSDIAPFPGDGGQAIHYYLFTPADLREGDRYPLAVWLHGGVKSNGRGGPNLPEAAFYRPEHQAVQPCFVLRPVAIRGTNWVSPRGAGTASHRQPAEPSASMALLIKLLDQVQAEQPIDTNRVIVFGASMGGYGVWDLIERHPERFAAAIPICGGGDPERAAALRDARIWAFHSADDRIVPVRGSREMFAALAAARGEEAATVDDGKQVSSTLNAGNLRYTEFKSGGHDAWTRALRSDELFRWAWELP